MSAPSNMCRSRARRQGPVGFTLVELLVVIAVIGVLVALLLPAVQAARESARRARCRNHLKQIGLAFLNHAGLHGHFPSSGWGWKWVGDPDRGFGPEQPGTWTYNILPFLEQESLRELGSDRQPNMVTADQKAGAATVVTTPLATMHCPSRRAAKPYPGYLRFEGRGFAPHNAEVTELLATCDYAVCAGHKWDHLTEQFDSPAPPEAFSFNWGIPFDFGGISFKRSRIGFHHVTDGTSATYMVGEKFHDPDYYDRPNLSDHHGLYALHSTTVRFGSVDQQPWRDRPTSSAADTTGRFRFGSAHPTAWHVVFCDGSAHGLSYDIDPKTHERLARRDDGQPVDQHDL